MLQSKAEPSRPLHRFAGHFVGETGLLHQVSWRGKVLVWKVSTYKTAVPTSQKRTEVTHFSRASRLRMLKLAASIRWEKSLPASFLTLTWDEESDDTSYRRATQARHVFWRYLEAYTGKHQSGIWRIEWKPRQSGRRVGVYVPHVHIMALRVPFVPWQRIREWWQASLQAERATTHVQSLPTPRQAGYYIAKYVGKVEASCSLDNAAYLNSVNGRHWGVFRKSLLPRYDEARFALPNCELVDFAYDQALAGLKHVNRYGNGSFTLLGDHAERIGKLLLQSGLTTYPTNR